MTRYFVGFLITVGLIVLLIVLLFTGGNDDKSKTPEQAKLYSYASTDAETSAVIDGPVTAQQTHDAIRIRVSRSSVIYEQIRGYDGQVVRQKTYDNSENSYETFLYALARSGFTTVKADPDTQNEKGACPLGSRYVFEVNEGSQQFARFWSTTCGVGNFEGEIGTILELFQDQVPDYSELVEDLNIEG